MAIAARALKDLTLRDQALQVQFFTRSTVYVFGDGSVLTVNMFGPSYAA